MRTKNPIKRKIINALMGYGMNEYVAWRIYDLTRFLYGSNWDRQKSKHEPVTDRPDPIHLSKIKMPKVKKLQMTISFNSPEQELDYWLKKTRTKLEVVQKLI